jgi:hypothetical protein
MASIAPTLSSCSFLGVMWVGAMLAIALVNPPCAFS